MKDQGLLEMGKTLMTTDHAVSQNMSIYFSRMILEVNKVAAMEQDSFRATQATSSHSNTNLQVNHSIIESLRL